MQLVGPADRVNLSCTCKFLRDAMWVEDKDLRELLRRNNKRKPIPTAAIMLSFERGAKEEKVALQQSCAIQ